MATAVGTFGLPILGCAFVAEGLVNTLGYEANFMAKGYSLAKGLYNSAKKVIGMAEESPDNQKAVIQAIHKDVKQAGNEIAPEAKKLAGHAQKAASTIAAHAKDAEAPVLEPHGMMDTVKSFFFREKLSESRKPKKDERNIGA